MHDIAVVGSDAALVTFAVADDVLFGQTELLAQVGTKLDGLQIHLLEVGAVREAVFTNFESDMGVVCAAACMPAAMIPRQRLVGGDAAVCQFADETMDAYLTTAGVVGVPMVVVLVLAQFAVIGSDIALQPRIVCAGAVYHDALDGDLASCFVAGILRKDELDKLMNNAADFTCEANVAVHVGGDARRHVEFDFHIVILR